MNAPKIPKKNPPYSKLHKHKQLQSIYKIKLIVKAKKIEIRAKMVEREVHNMAKREIRVKGEI